MSIQTPVSRFYAGKRVLITGHTGFKGSWLCLWLHALGAKVTGYALDPPTSPSLFDLCHISKLVKSVHGDIRDAAAVKRAMLAAKPDIIIHMAAQPLVRASYDNPVETYATNVMGTVHLLDAVRQCPSVQAVVNVTTDKCYENMEWHWGYRENDRLGGYDPYSNSKACSELVTAAYRSSFFNDKSPKGHQTAIATARAGNVIGGGDWAADRLVPDCIRSLLSKKTINVRNPSAIRPWQHVLEPLRGYLILAMRLCNNRDPRSIMECGDASPLFPRRARSAVLPSPDSDVPNLSKTNLASSWNFGPSDQDCVSVQHIVNTLCSKWGCGANLNIDNAPHQHEAQFLKLDCSKAKTVLNWLPTWHVDKALDMIVEWTKAYQRKADLRAMCIQQIEEYEAEAHKR